MTSPNCPCGSDKNYKDCCHIYHSQENYPSSPGLLMRSRFSAFVKGQFDCLVMTCHPSNTENRGRDSLVQSATQTEWLSLKVISEKPKAISDRDTTGFVEFVAFFKNLNGADQKIHQLHENSEFVKENDRWFYLRGEILDPIKLGRNDPCWCGSGKKLKKCHPE